MSIKDKIISAFYEKDESKRMELVYVVLTILTLLVHIIYSVFFEIYNMHQLLVTYNIFSIILYFTILLFRNRISISIYMIIWNIEVSFFTSLAILNLGFDYGFQILFLLLMSANIVFLSFKPGIKYAVISMQGALFLILYIREIQFSNIPLSSKTFYIINYVSFVAAIALVNYMSASFFEMKNKLANTKLTEEKNKYKKIAEYDALTGLFRKYYMEQKLDKSIEEYREGNIDSIVVIFSDIDNFKNINDTYGHANGDIVLARIGDVFRKNFRQEDFLCRWGGEEFIVLMKNVKRGYAYSIVDKIREKVSQEIFAFEGENISVTMTFGVCAAYDRKEITRDEITNIADELLYEGKKSGKNKVVYKEI